VSQGKWFKRPYLEKKSPERAGEGDQCIGPEFKPQYCKKKEKKSFCKNAGGLKETAMLNEKHGSQFSLKIKRVHLTK
jgi:hypothetical protein